MLKQVLFCLPLLFTCTIASAQYQCSYPLTASIQNPPNTAKAITVTFNQPLRYGSNIEIVKHLPTGTEVIHSQPISALSGENKQLSESFDVTKLAEANKKMNTNVSNNTLLPPGQYTLVWMAFSTCKPAGSPPASGQLNFSVQ